MITQYTPIAQQGIMDTYVPIPFEQLMAIAKENKQDYDTSIAKQQAAAEKFGSIIASTTADKLALKAEKDKVLKLAEDGASNSDLLKDPMYQAKMNQNIANMDYSLLRGIAETTRNVEKQQDIINQMKANKSYNWKWHNDLESNLKNWNTATQGVYQPKALTPYAETKDIVDRLTGEVKPVFRQDGNGNIVSDRHGNRVQEISNAQLTSIVNSREYYSDPQMKIATDVYLRDNGINPESLSTNQLELAAKKIALSDLRSRKEGIYEFKDPVRQADSDRTKTPGGYNNWEKELAALLDTKGVEVSTSTDGKGVMKKAAIPTKTADAISEQLFGTKTNQYGKIPNGIIFSEANILLNNGNTKIDAIRVGMNKKNIIAKNKYLTSFQQAFRNYMEYNADNSGMIDNFQFSPSSSVSREYNTASNTNSRTTTNAKNQPIIVHGKVSMNESGLSNILAQWKITNDIPESIKSEDISTLKQWAVNRGLVTRHKETYKEYNERNDTNLTEEEYTKNHTPLTTYNLNVGLPYGTNTRLGIFVANKEGENAINN